MAICKTGCVNNSDICDGGALCCIGFSQGCGEGCTDLADGESRIQIDNNGDLVVCSNVGGVCTCDVIAGGAPINICAELANCDLDDLGDVIAGAVVGQGLTFDGTNWVPTTLATGNSDSFVNLGNGVFRHTAVDGIITGINICTELVNCDLENLGNVAPGATAGQILIYDGTNWVPANQAGSDSLLNNADGTFTHTAVDGTITVIDICANLAFCTVENLSNVSGTPTDGQVLTYNFAAGEWQPTTIVTGSDSLVNNGDGSFTHTSVSGAIVNFDVCTALANCNVETLNNVLPGAVNGQILVFDGTNWVPTNQTANTDSLVDNGDGTYTHTAVDGLPTLIDICGDLIHCNLHQMGDVTPGATAGQVLVYNGTNWVPSNPPLNVDTLVNNGDGSFTHTAVDGTPIVINICTMLGDADCAVETMGNVAAGAVNGQVLVYNGTDWIPTTLNLGPDTLVNNGDGSFTHTAVDGTPVTIDVCALLNNCTLENLGNVAAGAANGQYLQFNGTNWIPVTLPNDTLVNNGNGTYTHTSTVGVATVIDICAAIGVLDTNCMDVTLTPTPTGCQISVDPILDPDPCNGLVCNANGLFLNNDIQTVTDFVTVPSNLVNIAAPGGLPAVPTVFGGTVNLTLANPSLCNPMSFTREVPASVAVFINNCGVAPAVISGTLEWSANGGATWNTVETASATVGVGEEITLPIAGITSSFIQAIGGTNTLDVRATFWNPDGNFCGTFSTADKSISGNGVNYIV